MAAKTIKCSDGYRRSFASETDDTGHPYIEIGPLPQDVFPLARAGLVSESAWRPVFTRTKTGYTIWQARV